MATHQTTIPIPLCLPRDEATALSELAKRVDYDDCVRLSMRFVFYTGRSEYDVMSSALHMLGAALAEAGFAPR
jgi:hypothetical protein